MSAGNVGTRVAGAIGVLAALAMFVLVVFVFPAAPASRSFGLGVVLTVVVAAGPVAAMAPGVDPGMVVSIGGAMWAAGLATMVGGNFPMLLMAVPGLILLFAGAVHHPRLSVGLLARVLLYGVLLTVGARLALRQDLSSSVGALGIAAIVATSSRWDHVGTQR